MTTGAAGRMPVWQHVVAVVAHPDDESFGLGAVLAAFVDAGADVAVLCLTHGEASTLHGVEGDLATIRRAELAAAGAALGISSIRLLDYADGRLADVDLGRLSDDVINLSAELPIDGIVVFDSTGITGHPDHIQATRAAVLAAQRLAVGVLAWTLPTKVADALRDEFGIGFEGRQPADIDLVLEVDRTRQRVAVDCHPSQAVPGSALWRRLDLLGGREYLRWLVTPAEPPTE